MSIFLDENLIILFLLLLLVRYLLLIGAMSSWAEIYDIYIKTGEFSADLLPEAVRNLADMQNLSDDDFSFWKQVPFSRNYTDS